MVKVFQGNIVPQAILVLVALLLLWGRSLAVPPSLSADDHPAILYGLLCQWLAATPRLAVVIAMLLALVEGVLLNLVLAGNSLVPQNSLLPTLLFVVATGAGATTLTPLLIVGGAAIAVLHNLMLRGTLLTITPGKICTATTWIAIASLFFQPAIFLLITYIFVALSYRLYSLRDWLLMLLGFAAPYMLLTGILYMAGGLNSWWDGTLTALGDYMRLTQFTDETFMHMLGYIVLAVVFLWGMLHIVTHMSEHPVAWQKNAATVMLFAVGAALMLLYQPLLPFPVALFAIPFSFCCTRMLLTPAVRHTGFGRRKSHLWMYDATLIFTFIAALLC